MRPKLIVLNGPLGIGKTTLANRYASDHSLTLTLDIDDIRTMLSHWRQEKDASAQLSKEMALELARLTLQAGHDVIVPQILQTHQLADSFKHIATECDAHYYEIMLIVEKEEALNRFIARSKSQGHTSGFREGGLIATSGREVKLAEMYDNMMAIADSRPHVMRIEPVLGDIEGTYKELTRKLREDRVV